MHEILDILCHPLVLPVTIALVAGVAAFLAPGGIFAVELAPDQAPIVADGLSEAGPNFHSSARLSMALPAR